MGLHSVSWSHKYVSKRSQEQAYIHYLFKQNPPKIRNILYFSCYNLSQCLDNQYVNHCVMRSTWNWVAWRDLAGYCLLGSLPVTLDAKHVVSYSELCWPFLLDTSLWWSTRGFYLLKSLSNCHKPSLSWGEWFEPSWVVAKNVDWQVVALSINPTKELSTSWCSDLGPSYFIGCCQPSKDISKIWLGDKWNRRKMCSSLLLHLSR